MSLLIQLPHTNDKLGSINDLCDIFFHCRREGSIPESIVTYLVFGIIESLIQCRRFGIVGSSRIMSQATFLVVRVNSRNVILLLLPVWNKNQNLEYILFLEVMPLFFLRYRHRRKMVTN